MSNPLSPRKKKRKDTNEKRKISQPFDTEEGKPIMYRRKSEIAEEPFFFRQGGHAAARWRKRILFNDLSLGGEERGKSTSASHP